MSGRRPETEAASAVVLGLAGAQYGVALGASLIGRIGPFAVVSIRQIVAAVALVAIARPHLPLHNRRALRQAVVLGVVMAVLSNSVSVTIDRLGVGPAITLEFLGPLAVTILTARRRLDVGCGIVAALGVGLLVSGPVAIDALGLMCGFLAAAALAGYIVLNQRLGRAFAGLQGAALAATSSAVLCAPFGLLTAAGRTLEPNMIIPGVLAGLLASALPFAVDTFALRRLRRATFGVLTSVSPVMAALAGLVVLGEQLGFMQWLAVGLISAASAVAVFADQRQARPRVPIEPT